MVKKSSSGRTTVGVREETHSKLRTVRPDGLSDDEFLRLLLRRWEE